MKQSFFLAWMGLKGRKRSTALLLSTIVIAVAFLVVMGLVGSSALYTVDCQNKDLYGEQKLLAWNLTKEQKGYFESSAVWDEIGKIKVYGTVTSVSGTVIGIGTMDEEAVRLGHIRLAEGRLPQRADEVVVEKGAYRYVGGEAYAVGDEIVLEVAAFGEEAAREKCFRVVGVMENYSAVWRKEYAGQGEEENGELILVSFWVGGADRDAAVGVDGGISVGWGSDSAGDLGVVSRGGTVSDLAGDSGVVSMDGAIPDSVDDLTNDLMIGGMKDGMTDVEDGLNAGWADVFGGGAVELWLLNSPSNSYRMLHDNLPEKAALHFNYSVYPQIGYYGGMSEAALAAVQLEVLIGGILLVCMMAILLNGFLMSVDRRKRQLSLLRCIGATKKQAQTCLLCEAFLLMAMGIPAGLLVGILGSFGVVRGFSALGGMEIVYHFDAWVLVLAVFVCMLCVFLAVWLPAVRASRVTPIVGTREVYFRRKTGNSAKHRARLRPFDLMLVFMQKSKGKTALTTVTFALVIVVFHVMMMTDIVEYQSGGAYRRADARLTVLEDLREGIGEGEHEGKEDGIKTAAIPAEIFSDFRNSLDVAYQNAAVMPMFSCRIPFSRYDAYLNGHFRFDYKMLGLRNWEKWGQYHYSFEEQMLCGYRDQEYLITPRITLLDDFLLGQSGAYVTDGDVDIEAIKRGEEIILCMPDYYLVVQEEENGVQFQEQILDAAADAPKDARLFANTVWRAGDVLTFTWIKEQGGANILHERTVKIGAVVKGMPQVEGALSGFFRIVVGENTLENLEVPYEISEVYVSFGEDADIPVAEADLKQIAAQSYPLAELSVRTEEAVAEQQQRKLMLAVSGMIMVCLFIMGIFGLMNTVSSRVHSRLHEIGMLRCIGMTKGQVYRMFLYEGCVFGILASGIGTAASCWMLEKWGRDWWNTQMPFYFVGSCFACVAVSVLMVFLSVRGVMRKGVVEVLGGEE